MRRPGQPLRFLGWVVGGWIAMRVAVLLMAAFPFMGGGTKHGGSLAAAGLEASRQAPIVRSSSAVAYAVPSVPAGALPVRRAPGRDWAVPAPAPPVGSGGAIAVRAVARLAVAPDPQREDGQAAGASTASIARAPETRGVAAPRRWSATAWMLWRPEVAGGLAQAPLLGGSQAGVRVDYRVAEGRLGRLGLYGRVSRALTGAPAEEAALGAAFRPGRAPVSVLVERRQRLGRGGRSGFALLAAGGLGPREVAPRLVAEGYAQAGVVGLPGLDGFADGKASLGYRLTPRRAASRLVLGASLSGGVQPGAERLDVGPELSLRLPAGAAALRLSVEWRERILGDARPARGPAVTLVGDF